MKLLTLFALPALAALVLAVPVEPTQENPDGTDIMSINFCGDCRYTIRGKWCGDCHTHVRLPAFSYASALSLLDYLSLHHLMLLSQKPFPSHVQIT